MRKFVLVVGAFVLLAGTAQARFYVPRHHHACKAGFVRRHARVRRHHHWVRQARCVYVKHAKPVGAVAPKVSYSARVDPTFTQASSDPLAVTYDYSADATQTTGTVTTNLAAVNQLPAGVLDFYSATSPGGPEQLFCSINVGGATTGSTCPITYGATGTYDVTTEYIPSGTTAVTDTAPETISPFSTTTSVVSAASGSETDYSPAAADQNSNALTPDASEIRWELFDTSTGQSVGTFDGVGVTVWFREQTQFNSQPPYQSFGRAICVLHVGQSTPTACGDIINPSDSFTVQATYSPSDGAPYLGSVSQAVPLTLSP